MTTPPQSRTSDERAFLYRIQDILAKVQPRVTPDDEDGFEEDEQYDQKIVDALKEAASEAFNFAVFTLQPSSIEAAEAAAQLFGDIRGIHGPTTTLALRDNLYPQSTGVVESAQHFLDAHHGWLRDEAARLLEEGDGSPDVRAHWQKLTEENAMTNHSTQIANLRNTAETTGLTQANDLRLAADLLEIHDATGISLDAWPAARGLVENLIGHRIEPNNA